MLTQATLGKMHAMKMHAMAEALEHQIASHQYDPLAFEERIGMLVDSEYSAREQRKLARRLRIAKLRYPASVEDIDFSTPRGLDRPILPPVPPSGTASAGPSCCDACCTLTPSPARAARHEAGRCRCSSLPS